MANKKDRRAASPEVMILPLQLSEMLSRTPFDLPPALQGKKWGAPQTAAPACNTCLPPAECERSVAKQQQGDGSPVPSFCPNARFIRSNAPRRVQSPTGVGMEAHTRVQSD